MAKRTYTQEEKLRAVVAHLERGQSISEVAKAYGLPAQQVRSWVKKYQAQGFARLEDRRGKRLPGRRPGIRRRPCGVRTPGCTRKTSC